MRVTPEALISEFKENSFWQEETIADHFFKNVQTYPEQIALVDAPNREDFMDGAPKRYSYTALAEAVENLARLFVREGIGKDDILLVQLPNISELVITYFAAWRVGAIMSPVAIQFREHELRPIAKILKPKALITCSRFKDFDQTGPARACQDETGYKIFVFGDTVPASCLSLSTAMEEGQGEGNKLPSKDQLSADDVATICWTSGTEGIPKGVPRSHNHWLAISYGTFDAMPIEQGDTILNPFPLYNMASIGGLFLSWVHAVGCLILHHPLDLPVFLKQIAQEKVQHTLAPPAILNMILKDERLRNSVDFSSLRCIGSGSAPLDPWMVEGFADEFGIDIVNIFGSNEGIALVSGPSDVAEPAVRAALFPRFGRKEFTWENRASRFFESQLRDLTTGEEITTPGEVGEMVIKGATVFNGYFRADDLTRAAFTEDGFYRTGDLFEIAGPKDNPCYYKFAGRSKQIIIRGGQNISPEELDRAIGEHPKIAEAATVGYADETMGERVCLVAALKPGETLSLDDITSFLRSKGMAVFKFPERLRLVEALPRNPMNKVVRKDLAALARQEET